MEVLGEQGRDSAIHIHVSAKSLQSCPTLCDPIDSSPPGSPVPGILQARTLEWVIERTDAEALILGPPDVKS